MHITANLIGEWARTKKAQADLPRLVRRLIHAGASVTGAAFPAGDSTGLPGWDGELDAERGTPWIPKGKSFWELSCEAKVTTKANQDYAKRTHQTPKKIRSKATLVVLTARKWNRKTQWLQAKRRAKRWKQIRAYDANDLEQWLELAPAVALQFAEELGLHGPGVETVARYWEDWSQQSKPAITAEALFVDRQDTRDRLLAELHGRLKADQAEPYTIKADSVEEATAFVCAALLTNPELSGTSLVVTEPNGWGYVEQNQTLNVALAARPEFAEKPSRRSALVTIIPYATGEMGGYYRGVAGREGNAELTIARPRIYEFEKALCSIGLDEAESKRMAISSGRSWSVYRRRCATNPALRKPVWLDMPQAGVLSTLCLLGGWSGNKPADREIVAQVSGRPYEDVERALRHLAQVDDAPVLQIGEVWKAKSPLELLDLFGDRITSDELDRFFKIAQSILVTPDPQLDLPDEERHAAQIYGKVRPQSALLIEALCDTLIKLAVRGAEVPALASTNIEGRVAALVHDLLHNADATRWLSLASLLPDLAEAAPSEFLKAVEESLAKPDVPVTRLLTETSNSGLLGRCWHSGLLWALERLAWLPERLARVSLILARLSPIKVKGNWANTPLASLVDIYRSWYPRTAADVSQRIAVLDTLIAKEPDAAFELLANLVHLGSDSAHPTARLSWRDDDARVGYGATPAEGDQMDVAAADRLIACSKDHPQRLARLIEKIPIFDKARINTTLALADQFTKSVSDEDREIIRAALRKHIHWHRNYDKASRRDLAQKLKDIEDLYEKLAPKDLIVRYRWLFRDGWPKLPARVRDAGYGKRGELVETWRTKALSEVHSERGFSGIEQLAIACTPHSYYVGLALSKLNIPVADLAEWVADKGGNFTFNEPLTMAISGLLRAVENPRPMQVVKAVLERGRNRGWDPGRTARFLVLGPEHRSTWEIVASCGTEVEQAYWATTTPSPRLSIDEGDFEFALRRLLAAGRPRTALQVSHFDMKKAEPTLLAEMLERFLKGEEPEGPSPDSWSLGEAIDALEASESLEKDRLMRLEFGLIPALGYEGEQHATSLYSAILSDPRLFTELLCILYRPANADHEDDIPSEASQAAARIAWRVLHHCRRLPGAQPDGTVDRDSLLKFVDETRELCRQADRLAVCDRRLGEILAQAPEGADGVWPFEPARDVLDRPELEDMRRGFHTGTMNKRGVTSRSPDEGGGQERGLAEEYRRHARALQHSHVNLAAGIEEIARSYERYGQREDVEAQLRREGC